MSLNIGQLGVKLGLPGFHIPLRSALDEIEHNRLERTSGTSIFAWPVRVQQLVLNFFATSSWAFLLTLFLGFFVFMYLIDAIPSLFSLRWSQQPVLCELPDGIRREMIRGSEGKLEVLIAESPTRKRSKPAILFIHGGFGSASVWLPWMKYLHGGASNAYAGNVYALSLRGHGGSFAPGFVEMTYLTSLTTLSTDVVAAMLFLQQREASAGSNAGFVIAAHSSGGGLVQHALASGKLPVKASAKIGGLKGLALVASVPPYGSAGTYFNWFLSDPLIWVRSYLQFGHPRSPLASTKLVRRAFFSENFPEGDVKTFEKAIPKYESLIWPSQMMFGRFVDVDEILSKLEPKNVLVMATDQDRLMGVQGQRKMAKEYANVLRAEDMEAEFTNKHNVRILAEGTIDGKAHQNGSHGSLQLNLIRGSGHHLQNDVQRDEAAEVFKDWAESV